MTDISREQVVVAVVGLGYVGLPLAVEFSQKFKTFGYDINDLRIDQLRQGIDVTNEIALDRLKGNINLTFTSSREEIVNANFYIVTVPTPVDDNRCPDLSPLMSASKSIAECLKVGDTVVFESTVFPGATEEVCVPILEDLSGLMVNKDFFVGYSPERINPGDKVNTISKICKITSGSCPDAAIFIDGVYREIIAAGTYMASSIKVAEAAKVIENTQRDLNIAAVNEFAKIFSILGIDTGEVIEAAGTKWNFIKYKPGLVGGHCISVDPYYLTYKAISVGYTPEVILAGRRINDEMPKYVVSQLLKALIKKQINVSAAKVLLMGITFKGNCPDIRNTKVVDIYTELLDLGICVQVFDPVAPKDIVTRELGINLLQDLPIDYYDAVVIAVDHSSFVEMGAERIRRLCKPLHVLYDVKQVFAIDESDIRL